jgi:hypothetical protein
VGFVVEFDGRLHQKPGFGPGFCVL